MKKKGFTLVELIITISIFGLIMLVSVPNIVSMVDKNKRKAYLNDAKKLVKLARYKFYTEYKYTKPNGSTCRVYRINDLDTSNLDAPPNGGEYDSNYSYVQVKYESSTYKFKVQLLEEYTVSGGNFRYRGVTLTDSTNLDKMDATASKVSSVKTNRNDFRYYTNSC